MMESRLRQTALFWISAVAIFSFCSGTDGYYNSTLLWKNNANFDYIKWGSSMNFSLGDFIIFKTDTNHTIIQTYNATVYENCESDADDSLEYSAGQPSTAARPATIAVPLVQTGENFFFSGLYDGEQCRNGQRFQIMVEKGAGLPPELTSSSAPPENHSMPLTATHLPSNVTNPIASAAKPFVPDKPNDASCGILHSFLFSSAAVLFSLFYLSYF
eukprot:TRINITY_DN20392_c0_g1_i1.p1 TRINITY_DN20392_c0_g1~~TRINITY_DN20392_c0_g1_i1.p1  ORF type:complete len:215 (-),score=10.20 TRINITY_DN20392_c0_g1_i1:122-766(-)